MEIDLCDDLEDRYKNGDTLEIEYKGEKRQVQYIKPILLAKAGAGFMAMHDGKQKSFALDKCENINKVDNDECLLSSDSDEDNDKMKSELHNLQKENSELQMMIGQLETQIEAIRFAVGEAL
eukprot:COSAG02_NODE_1246_length_13659_cov_23.906858_11_plen_122_part_00